MGASIESMLLVARLDEMGILNPHDGQTLADIALAIDVIQRGNKPDGDRAEGRRSSNG